MNSRKLLRVAIAIPVLVMLFWPPRIIAKQNQVMGELKFSGATKAEESSGVWVDGQYLGYLKELKGSKKIVLMPGSHDIAVRQAGYEDFTKKVIVEPGKAQVVSVHMLRNPQAVYPVDPGAGAATLKFDVTPDRSAVFIDDTYMGPASNFGGFYGYLTVVPGKHRVKIDLPGYQTFETDISVLPGQKAEIKTDLIKGSIEHAGALIKQR